MPKMKTAPGFGAPGLPIPTMPSAVPSQVEPVKRCPKCKTMIPKGAEKCPNCRSAQWDTPTAKAAIGITVALIIAGVLWWSMKGGSYSSDSDGGNGTGGQSRTDAWLSGGTLHKATMQEWYAASYRNKLATAADFVAKASESGDMGVPPFTSTSDMKRYAEHLVADLDESCRGLESVQRGQKVAAIAAAIFVLWKGGQGPE